ncbi:hypothetical protein [Aquipuribacter sp. SD81]|uniref:hypothetical protein n=1 Tax=Aquipuribacter sp. SD81 TaxID=3127703 RepID=UPI003019E651
MPTTETRLVQERAAELTREACEAALSRRARDARRQMAREAARAARGGASRRSGAAAPGAVTRGTRVGLAVLAGRARSTVAAASVPTSRTGEVCCG